jgi:hypothetical protein
MKIKFLIIFQLLTLSLTAQIFDKNPRLWMIKVNTTSILNFQMPSVDYSIEKCFAQKYSIMAEFGTQLIHDKSDTTFIKPYGFKTKFELRKYHNDFYYGLNFFTRNQLQNSTIYYASSDTSAAFVVYQEDFAYKKTQWGINAIIGVQKIYFKRLVVDAYIGFGYRNRSVTNYFRTYDPKKFYIPGTDLVPLFTLIDLSESSKEALNMTMGLRVGFTLNKVRPKQKM